MLCPNSPRHISVAVQQHVSKHFTFLDFPKPTLEMREAISINLRCWSSTKLLWFLYIGISTWDANRIRTTAEKYRSVLWYQKKWELCGPHFRNSRAVKNMCVKSFLTQSTCKLVTRIISIWGRPCFAHLSVCVSGFRKDFTQWAEWEMQNPVTKLSANFR